ncbi:MAG: type II methionyl aminopeptidase [Candidatus Woesearchaeota archaeon]
MAITLISEEEYQYWKNAGKLTKQVKEYAKSIAKQGMPIVSFAALVEEKIRLLGAQPAFPINISFNSCAAHDTADQNDTRCFGNDLVKIDLGVAINGYFGDTAFTLDFTTQYRLLVEAAEKALDNAIAIAKPGVTIGKIGKTIQETIQQYGFVPISNLSGHGLARYEIHTEPTIPNYDTGSAVELKKGMILAIEPFATNGHGRIIESGKPRIFSLQNNSQPRSPHARKVLELIKPHKTLPFSLRDFEGKINEGVLLLGIKELLQQKIVRAYPPLVEISKGMVSQAEHTILITATGCEILT